MATLGEGAAFRKVPTLGDAATLSEAWAWCHSRSSVKLAGTRGASEEWSVLVVMTEAWSVLEVPLEGRARGAGDTIAAMVPQAVDGWWRRCRERGATCLVLPTMTMRPRAAAGCAEPLPPILRRREERRDLIVEV